MAAFKGLIIDHSLINGVISTYCQDLDADIDFDPNKDYDKYTVRFKDPTKKAAQLFVYKKKDGTTTLDYERGKNQIFSESLATKIKDTLSIEIKPINGLYFSSICNDKRDEFLSYLPLIEAKMQICTNGAETHYNIKGRQNENLKMIHYGNSAIHFQGKASLLFYEVIDILLDVFPIDDVQKNLLKSFNIQRPKEEIISEFETKYPSCAAALDDKLTAIILPSLELQNVVHHFSDYSYLAYAPLRALEGVMKLIFQNNGITISNKEGFGDYFSFNHARNTWQSSNITETKILCKKTIEYLVKMYTIYNKERNRLFHVDSINPAIISRDEAISITDSVLNLLEEYYV